MKTTIFLILIVCFRTNSSFAQNFYRLSNGPVKISGIYKDSLVIAESNKLYFLFNYQSNEVLFKLPINSLTSDNKFLDSLFIKEKLENIIFKGKIITDYDITSEHPTLNVTIEGNLDFKNRSTPFSFQAIITHLISGAASCNISSIINLDISKYYSDAEKLGFHKEVNIIFSELILEKSNQK